MQEAVKARLRKTIPSASYGFIFGALLVTVSPLLPLVLVWAVGPLVIGSILFASSGARLNLWKAIAALLLSVPAYLFTIFGFSMTVFFAQTHGVHSSGEMMDLGGDTLCGLAAAILIGFIEIELLAWLLSGCWSMRHALLLVIAGMLVLAITYGTGAVASRFAIIPRNPFQLMLFFGPLFTLGIALVTAIVEDQMRHTTRIGL